MIKIVILGGGNVAFHLINEFLKKKSVKIIQLYNRSIEKIKPFEVFAPITNNLTDLKDADVYIIAVSDNHIAEISQQLHFKDKLVVHTSGAHAIEELKSNSHKGVFYPLQTFSKNKKIDFSTTPICIEATDKKSLKILEKLAKSVSEKTYEINSTQRKSLHVAAVFVNNFVNHLFTVGKDICDKNNIPFEILLPIIHETAQKIETINPKEAQTGPAIRQDNKTIDQHLAILTNNQQEIYKLLTNSIIKHHGKKL